jgi:outer membrane protein assembly factor BamD (BamD/ComL family)
MSISGVAGTALSSLLSAAQGPQKGQGNSQQIQSEFQQLGQDLQTGNLAQAQQDYATLSQNFAPAQSETAAAATTAAATTTAAAQAANSNPIAQAFDALSTDLQNGNITAAQQDYATIQQDAQQQQGSSQVHHHHHGGGGGGGQKGSQISQTLSSLSSALQSGNLSSAQTAFATLQQDLEQFSAGGSTGSTNGTSSSASQTTGSALNVTA